MSVLVDSDLIIDGLKNVSGVLQFLESFVDDGLVVSTITLAEVFEGAFFTRDPVQHLMSARVFLERYTVVDVTDPVAERFAELRAGLR